MRKISIKRILPSRMLVMSFLIIIVIGTVFLSLPQAVNMGQKISVLTALFTATSAVSVTGLSLVDVSEVFSVFGKIVILILIQLGGLGIMTFSSIIMLAIGKQFSYHEQKILKEDLNSDQVGGVLHYVKIIIAIVASIEIMGAILLTVGFLETMPVSQAILYGIFHSISAFCNAGFSLFSDSLEGFKGNYIVNYTVSGLIFLGGIGFAVIMSTIRLYKTNVKRYNLTSKLAIIISVFLVILGTILFFVLEYANPNTIGNLSLFQKITASVFQSVSTRTAGFNTIPMGEMNHATIFLFILLMFIGASPGSTGGGIKTTTFGVIAFYVIGVLRNERDIVVTNRRISWEILNRAIAILVISVVYVSVVIMLLLLNNDLPFRDILFEVVSAFGTVGLSTGITGELNTFSKIIITITMLIGRVGPLTFALAFSEKLKVRSVRYPKENILIG